MISIFRGLSQLFETAEEWIFLAVYSTQKTAPLRATHV